MNRFEPGSAPGHIRDNWIPEGPRHDVAVSPGVYASTLDDDFKARNPAVAALNSYDGGTGRHQDLARSLGGGIRRFFQEGGGGHSVLSKGPWLGAPAGAAALGIPAWLAGKVLDWRGGGDSSWGTILGLLGSAVGAGLGGWGAGRLAKAGSAMTLDARARLLAVVNNDYTMSPAVKAMVLQELLTLPASESVRVFNLVPAAFGAGAGMLVARALGFGGLGMALGAGLGGWYGGTRPERDMYGNTIQRLPF